MRSAPIDGPELKHIACDVEDHILTITLSRPDRLNAFTQRMGREIVAAIDYADSDDDVRVVIVTGSGRGFCAGADLRRGEESFDRGPGEEKPTSSPSTPRDEGGIVALRIFQSLKPFIAAINGPAVGVGVTMTLPMDFRLASPAAKFAIAFARRGIVLDAASSWFLPRIVGLQRALDWSLTGRMIDIEEAREGGLIGSVHSAEELLPAARAIATEMVENTSAISTALVRQLLWRMSAESDPMVAHLLESRALSEIGASADAREGVVSFLEKRPPSFPLRPSVDMPAMYPWWTPPEF